MISLQITTSTQTITLMVAIPNIDDAIVLNYTGCGYCDKPIRREVIKTERKFCNHSHQELYRRYDLAHVDA